MNGKIDGLAETLKSLGIVSSASDAMNLAKNIVTTEEKLARNYGITKPLQGKTKSYQEEIDELIRKTSPEYKQYHIPVKGYRKDENLSQTQNKSYLYKKEDNTRLSNTKESNTQKVVFYELEEANLYENKKDSSTSLIEKSTNIMAESNLNQETSEIFEKDTVTNSTFNETNNISNETLKNEVYTDLENSNIVLNELINSNLNQEYDVLAQETQFLPNIEEPIKNTLVEETNLLENIKSNNNQQNITNQEVEQNINKESEQESDFIIEIKDLETEKPMKPIENNHDNNKDQLFKEIKEDKTKTREIKNPIEPIDLMEYFMSKK